MTGVSDLFGGNMEVSQLLAQFEKAVVDENEGDIKKFGKQLSALWNKVPRDSLRELEKVKSRLVKEEGSGAQFMLLLDLINQNVILLPPEQVPGQIYELSRLAGIRKEARGMFFFAWCLQEGCGCKKGSPREVFGWLKKCADSGFARAYYEVATRYAMGTGTKVDCQKAEFYFEKAVSANPEDYDSVTALAAIRIKQGKKAEAREYLRRAAPHREEARELEGLI